MPASARCVQVTRDVALREFVHREQLQLGRDWGSGYPSGAVQTWQPCMCIPGTARNACACWLIWAPSTHSICANTCSPPLQIRTQRHGWGLHWSPCLAFQSSHASAGRLSAACWKTGVLRSPGKGSTAPAVTEAPSSTAYCTPAWSSGSVTFSHTGHYVGHATSMITHRALLASSKAAKQQSQQPAEQSAPPSSEPASSHG